MAAKLASALAAVLEADRSQALITGQARVLAEEALARYEAEGQPELIAGLLRACHRVIQAQTEKREPLPENMTAAIADMQKIVNTVANYAFASTRKKAR
jgi:hypothetical protein